VTSLDRPTTSEAPATIAICMATYNPDPILLRRQVRSIVAQSVQDWTCYISDDCSSGAALDSLMAEVQGDARFVVSRSDINLGVYRNFERALSLVPRGTDFVALSDQDDEWYPNKLAVLRDRLVAGVELVYSDFRIVDPDGMVLADSLWESRRNYWQRLDLLGVFNTVTGAAAMFPSHLLRRALPFPELPEPAWHDHWLTLLAVCQGHLAYVDEALFDHIHHGHNVSGHIHNTPSHRRWSQLVDRDVLTRAVASWAWHDNTGVRYVQQVAWHVERRAGASASPVKRRQVRRLVRLDRSIVSLLWVASLAAHRRRPDDFIPSRGRDLLRGLLYAHAARGVRAWRDATSRGAAARSTPPVTTAVKEQG